MKTATTIEAMSQRVLLMLGSNVDAQRQLQAACTRLRERFEVTLKIGDLSFDSRELI